MAISGRRNLDQMAQINPVAFSLTNVRHMVHIFAWSEHHRMAQIFNAYKMVYSAILSSIRVQ